MDLGDINAGELMQQRSHVKLERVGLLRTTARRGQRRFRLGFASAEQLQGPLDLFVAVSNSLLVEVEQAERLRKGEQVLWLVVANHGRANGGLAGAAIGVAHGREYIGIALSRDDGTDNLQ